MYRLAAYCRLSKEDGENKTSESIENQIRMIKEYVEKKEDLEIADIYADDGYSGLYFENRPEFQRMMEDIYNGRIDGVITKDISRLGREHIETSRYMERVFPALQIRYIAILDGVDSICHRNEELAQFQTLLNDMYSRDISKKIKGSLEIRKKQGLFVSGFAPYGYRKNSEDKYRFEIDEEAAEIVKRIYGWYLSGYSKNRIARILNEEGILTPSEYKRKVQGFPYVNAKERKEAKGWAYSTVHSILKNRVYTGAMVQHKSEKISYKVNKCRNIPEKEQYIVEDMHEAIIETEEFEEVQLRMKARTRTTDFSRADDNPYAGILVCGECGCHLQRVSARDGYECGSYHRKGNRVCRSHFVKKALLDHIVREELLYRSKIEIGKTEREELTKLSKSCSCLEQRRREMEQRRGQTEKALSSARRYVRKTLELYADGTLDQEEYEVFTREYQQRVRKLQQQIRKISEKIKEQNNRNQEKNWIELLLLNREIKIIPRSLVTGLIQEIVIGENHSIHIVWKYHAKNTE